MAVAWMKEQNKKKAKKNISAQSSIKPAACHLQNTSSLFRKVECVRAKKKFIVLGCEKREPTYSRS